MEMSGQLYAPTALLHERNAEPVEKKLDWLKKQSGHFGEEKIYCLSTGIQTPNLPARSLMNYTDRTVPVPYGFRLIVKINCD
jgi:hypothetical protein